LIISGVLQYCSWSGRLPSFSVGTKLIRHPYLRATLLLAFLILHVPGYGLHALVGIEHASNQSAACGGCAFCAQNEKLDGSARTVTENQDASTDLPQSAEQDDCCVCKQLATLATVSTEPAFATTKYVARSVHPKQVQHELAHRACYLARGPPA